MFSLKISDYIHTPAAKKFYNEEHFTESAPRYDLATILMSFAQDQNWKRSLIKWLPDFKAPNVLDLATGTGDLVLLLKQKYPDAKLLGVDITNAMLKIARQRCAAFQADFELQSIDKLPYPDSSFEVITGSYALRNSPKLSETLSEIYRCLSADGVVGILDFSKPDNLIMQKIQYCLLKFWGSMWGTLLHGNPEIHGYISASLAIYPGNSELNEMIKQAGFTKIERKSKFFGMISLLCLRK